MTTVSAFDRPERIQPRTAATQPAENRKYDTANCNDAAKNPTCLGTLCPFCPNPRILHYALLLGDYPLAGGGGEVTTLVAVALPIRNRCPNLWYLESVTDGYSV